MSRTAFSAPEITLMSLRPHVLLGMGLARHNPAIVWRGKVSAPTFPADGTGVGDLTVTSTVSGSFANVVEGMTVVFPTNPDNSGQYYTFARKAAISGHLYIDGLGDNTVSFPTVPSYNFTVYNQYLPQPRRFRYDSPDWFVNFDTAFVNQTEDYGPQAVMGPCTVVYKNGSVTSSFDGTQSATFSPGATITAYLWTFPDGTTSTSATPTWANSTAYVDGAYYHLRVTDSNGETHTGHRLYFKFDSTHKPKIDFGNLQLSGEWRGGWTAEIDSSDPLWDYGTVYNGIFNECILFGDTGYYTTKQNIGGNFPGSENIWLRGYLIADNYEFAVDGSVHTYTVSTIDELLRNQFAFPLTMDDTGGGAPTDWLEANPITLDLMALHYCRWRSTILMCTDVIFSGLPAATRDKRYMDLQDGSMWDQLGAIMSWVAKGAVSSDWQGAIYFEQDLFASRDTPVEMIQITLGLFGLMREGFTFPTVPNYINKVAKYSVYGVDYITPVGSRAPDDPAAHGAALEEISAGLAGTQAELNQWAGGIRQQLDNHFLIGSIPTRGIIRIDPTPQSTIGFVKTLALEYSLIVRSTSFDIDFENGMCSATFGYELLQTSTPPDGVDIDFT